MKVLNYYTKKCKQIEDPDKNMKELGREVVVDKFRKMSKKKIYFEKRKF